MKAKINEEIKEYCKLLKLKGMAQNFEELEKDADDYEDFLHKLLTCELAEAEKRARENRIRSARFPYRKYLEDLELDCLPKTMQKKLPELATLDFIQKGQNLIMTGNPGTGKSHSGSSDRQRPDRFSQYGHRQNSRLRAACSTAFIRSSVEKGAARTRAHAHSRTGHTNRSRHPDLRTIP